MRKIIIFTVLTAVFGGLSGILITDVLGENSTRQQGKTTAKLFGEAQIFANEFSTLVGVSISPLLGMSALGAYHYYMTPENKRDRLAWHTSPVFWGPLLVILIAFVLKDSAKTILPIPKPVLVPLDALEAIENKVSGLIALPVVLSMISSHESVNTAALALQKLGLSLFPMACAGDGVVQASVLSDPIALAKFPVVAILASFCFFLVWLVSHTINILILLCPFATIDFLLKMFRNSVIALLIGASFMNPYLGLFVSLLIVVFSYFVASWSFRLMVFGSIFSFDILSGKSKKYDGQDSEIMAFAGKDLPNVPSMSYGTLKKGKESLLEFTYNPWLFFPSRTVLTQEPGRSYEIGKGALGPVIMKPDQNSCFILFRLRPRYKSHEQHLADILGIDSIRDMGVLRGIREGWRWLCMQVTAIKNKENLSVTQVVWDVRKE